MEKILTVPLAEGEYKRYLATGNDYVSIPSISLNGEIESINVILDKTCSLIDFSGQYIVKPCIYADRKYAEVRRVESSYENSWIPSFGFIYKNMEVRAKVICPKGYKGFAYELTVKNTTGCRLDIKCGVMGQWSNSSSTVFHTRELHANRDIFRHSWTNSIIMELKGIITLAALAVSGGPDSKLEYDLEQMSYSILDTIVLEAYEEKTLYYYYSLNMEQDGAGTTNVDLRRRGGYSLYQEETRWLLEHSVKLQSGIVAERANRNLFFSYFYSAGYTIDTEEQVLLTSKSPKYYVSAAFWGRDSLLWSFPAICIVDHEEAKKVLLTCYTRYLKNAGIHSLYTNGTVLYPGFELDELAAYIIALDEYIEWTDDIEIMELPCIKNGIGHILNILDKWYFKEHGLYGTELDPSDDPVTYPYLIYDNMLVWRAFVFLGKHKFVSDSKAEELKENINKNGIIDGLEGRMYAWSSNGQGGNEVYDDPPGSLILMAYYGFCSKEDEIYKNTLQWIFSPNNLYYYKSERFESTGCIHTPYPWLMSICNYLLVFKDNEKIKMIEELELDNGFACESFDESTGILKTGGAFATFAGFFGYTMAKQIFN